MLDISAEDVDADLDGIQVSQGSTILVTPSASDDVQVRFVQLLVDGEVVASDVSYPWELPWRPAEVSGAIIQVRAVDTGGNSTVSSEVMIDVVPDVIPPELRISHPAAGEQIVRGFEAAPTTFISRGSSRSQRVRASGRG